MTRHVLNREIFHERHPNAARVVIQGTHPRMVESERWIRAETEGEYSAKVGIVDGSAGIYRVELWFEIPDQAFAVKMRWG